MKRTASLRYSLIGLTAMTLVFSCTKDKDDLKKPADRILGVWNIVKETEVTYNKTTGAYKDSSSVDIPQGLFTIDFRSNGNVYTRISENGQIALDTFRYELENESLLLIDGDEYIINKFTNDHLITTDYYDDNTSNVKHTLEFKK
ncbi:hypothetical protein D3H65_00975 [Paraflavitalea soli]|uniref:Lipocalin-like domain-containing protein n=1 Tax=Paraflavitalea soli TaxID=2315862 RepID=A0A3B7MHF0_9BACT|nr:hypothetical protein [Paraflavitalea soli]AXY72630.1 hypothetical protein D3H65_00975 [Paraflavitalea soli]